MSVLAVDILVKTMIEVAFLDYRANSWILDDIFSGLATDPLANEVYGYKEVEAAKQWFLNNNIPVYLDARVDSPKIPCITIQHDSTAPILERTLLADEGIIEEIDPQGRSTARIQKIYNNFTPKSYNPAKGIVTFPDNIDGQYVAAGQFLVSNKTGKAYLINKVLDNQSFQIATNIMDDFNSCYIAPASQLWNVHRELMWLRESLSIGMHTQSDPRTCIWLRQLMIYTFLRYKEAFLEGRGFEISIFNLGGVVLNPHFPESDKVYSCVLNLSGQVECSWIKFMAPKLQDARGGIYIIDGPKTPDQYQQYLKQGWAMEGDKPNPKSKKGK